ncbi:MAG: hypothetical protein ACRD6N_14880 [Pyrinomonadaceae bacterium]
MRTMRTLWFALLVSVGLYFLLTVLTDRSESAPNDMLTIVLSAAGTFIVIVSFFVKQKYLQRAAENQQPDQVQTAYIIAWAMCETCAMLGLLDFFLTGNRYYFLLMVISALGIAAQFPRRDHLLAATKPLLIDDWQAAGSRTQNRQSSIDNRK